ncbi:hypothetical protein RJ641_029078 [Dillenia turbinata]|uniref:Uncharacterized protein n=1 Tax=Dillenia turbinata TaxID=194707 RepID=A0AAN8W138_9MAGN
MGERGTESSNGKEREVGSASRSARTASGLRRLSLTYRAAAARMFFYTSVIVFLFFQFQTLTCSVLALNVSSLIITSTARPSLSSLSLPPPPQPHSYLEAVLKEIALKQKWNSEDIRVSELNIRKARFGTYQRYECRIRVGKSDFVFRFSDDVFSWKKFPRGGGNFESLVRNVGSKAVLDSFTVEGPLELLVQGNDELSLTLPHNTSHTGLKHILVGEGITIEVRKAREVSLFHAFDFASSFNRTYLVNGRNPYWPLGDSFCVALPLIYISGSASLVAYRSGNSDAYIETHSLPGGTIQLLPEKCYIGYTNKKRNCPIDSLSSRIALLEKLLKGLLGDRILQKKSLGFIKAKIKALGVVHFRIELERDVGSNDTIRHTLAEWRTQPTVERVWFEVVAKLDEGTLKPLSCQRVRPFIIEDSATWSNLMSNISFTKFPSVLVPPEALTLDVKW